MKQMFVIVLMSGLVYGCGTVKGTTSGFLDGASQDLKSLSDKVK